MFRTGDQIGPYILISKIGRGTFGVVWLAERRTTIATTKVALKMPLDEDVDLDTIREEANLWVHASGHPNVLPIIEANIYDDQVVIVSEYAPDGSLDARLKQSGGAPQSIEATVELASGILAGLEHLHSRHIIHRDVKPQNILLQGQIPRLADFGISRVVKTTSQSSIVAGTPVYMAPEAFDGKRNEQTDLWSVGVMTYQMLAGHLPFPQSDMTSLMGAILTRNPDPLPLSVPEPLQEVIGRALAKDVAQRYRSAAEMRLGLRRAMEAIQQGNAYRKDPAPNPAPSPPPPPAQPTKSQDKVWAYVVGGFLLVSVLVAARIATRYWDSERAASEQQSSLPEPPPKEVKNGDDLRRWLGMLGRWDDVPEVMRETGTELATNPGNPYAVRARCSAYYLIHEEDGVKRDAEQLEQLLTNPAIAEEYEARCYARWRLKRVDEALSDCTRAIGLDRQYTFARFTRGSIYAEKKDYDRAMADYTRGIELNPAYSLAYNNRGIVYYFKQEFGSAIADFNKAIGLDPRGAIAYSGLGTVHYAKQDYGSALIDFSKAIELDPLLANAYAGRGLTHHAKQEDDTALADLDKAIQLDPRNAAAYAFRGYAYDGKQDYDKAIASFNKAIQLDPKDASTYINRGNVYYKKKDYDNGLADFNKAVQLDPKNADAYLGRGNEYFIKEDYNHAIADYSKAIELNPQFGVAYGNRALAYEKTGESERADTDRQKAEELKKN